MKCQSTTDGLLNSFYYFIFISIFSILLSNNQITIAISTRVNITTIIIERFFFNITHQERIFIAEPKLDVTGWPRKFLNGQKTDSDQTKD